MICFIIPVVCVAIVIGAIALGAWGTDYDHPLAFIVALVIGISATFGAIGYGLNACDYADYLINPDVRIEYTEEKRDSLVQLLSGYNLMMENDVNASESYMTIHKDVREFNDSVRRADKWQDTWWAEGWLYDPTYVGLNTIPIN